MRLTGLASQDPPKQWDRSGWPELRSRLETAFKGKTRDEWCAIMEGRDVCFAPVLSFGEALQHPHNRARGTFVEVDGIQQPAPAPRFSRTPTAIQRPPARPGEHADQALADWGFAAADIAALRTAGALG